MIPALSLSRVGLFANHVYGGQETGKFISGRLVDKGQASTALIRVVFMIGHGEPEIYGEDKR